VTRFSEAGSAWRKVGSSARMLSTISTVLVPGWRWMARITARSSRYHEATLSVWTLLMMRPSSSSRTGEPLRYATMTGR